MTIVTPSEAIEKLTGFNDRIERLESNRYSNRRFRTSDLNKLKFELSRISLYASIALHCRNKKRSKEVVDKTRSNIVRAIDYIENSLNR